MSSSSRLNARSKPDAIELANGNPQATYEQIRQHSPELFEASYYLTQVQELLKPLAVLPPASPLKARLKPEDQKRLDDTLSHLLKTIQDTLTHTPFEFSIEEGSPESQDKHSVRHIHRFTTAVKNIDALLESIRKPLQDFETLHNLFPLVAQLQSTVDRAKASLAKSKDHNRRHEIEIEVLNSDLKDLEDLGSRLSRADQVRKEQLEKEINEHRQDLSRNSEKLDKRKKLTTGQQAKIDQAIQTLTQFLSTFDPQNPKPLPESLILDVLAQGEPVEFSSLSLAPDIRKILQEKREGEYTTFNVSANRKRQVRRWAPRLAVILALAGGAYAERDRIAEVFAGPRLDPVAFQQAGVAMPTDPETISLLTQNNPRIAVTKIKLLEAMGHEVDEYWRKTILWENSIKGIESVLVDMGFKGVAFSDENEEASVITVPPYMLRGLKALRGENIEVGFRIKKGDVDPDFKSRKPVPEIDLTREQLCEYGHTVQVILTSNGKEEILMAELSEDAKKSHKNEYCGPTSSQNPEKKDSPEVENLRNEVLNNPFISKYLDIPYRDHFRTLHSTKEIHDYLRYLLIDENIGDRQPVVEDFVNLLHKSSAEHLIVYEEVIVEGKPALQIRIAPEFVKVAKQFVGESMRFSLDFMELNHEIDLDENYSTQWQPDQICRNLGLPIVRCKLVVGGQEHNAFKSLPPSDSKESKQRIRLEEKYCTPEALLKFSGRNSLKEVFTEHFNDPYNLALSKEIVLTDPMVSAMLNRKQTLAFIRAKDAAEFDSILLSLFPLQAEPLNEEFVVVRLDPRFADAYRRIVGHKDVTISLRLDKEDTPYFPGKFVPKRVLHWETYCNLGSMVVNMSAPSQTPGMREVFTNTVQTPSTEDPSCRKTGKKRNLESVEANLRRLTTLTKNQLNDSKKKDLAAKKLEILNHPILKPHMSGVNGFSVLLAESEGELKGVVDDFLGAVKAQMGNLDAIGFPKSISDLLYSRIVVSDETKEEEVQFNFTTDTLQELNNILGNGAKVIVLPNENRGKNHVTYQGADSSDMQNLTFTLPKSSFCGKSKIEFAVNVLVPIPMIDKPLTLEITYSSQDIIDFYCK